MVSEGSNTVVADVSYPDLFARWERGAWRAMEIDLSVDRRHWHEEMDEFRRRAALWNYRLFVHGEQVVASTLAPFIDAAPRPEQQHFLATQQVDETRHAVFFQRFMDEVVGRDTPLPEMSWGYRRTFGRVDQLARELRRDPSLPRLAGAITYYHVVIESGLAQPGLRFIENNLEETGLLPGLLEGITRISLDEQRHIGFGVKFLSDVRDEPGCREAAAAMIRETLPLASSLYIPPNWDESYVEVFGYSLEDIYEFAIENFDAKLRAIGWGAEDLFGAIPWRMDQPPRERARRLLTLMKANYFGAKHGPARRDPETVELLFEAMALGVDERYAPSRPVTIAWDFDDFDPWHVTVENGRTHAAPGRPPDSDLVLQCGFEDWIDIAARRRDPRRALVTRRLRPRGDLRLLLRFQKMFGG